jgi:mannose-6-phosphate isomerase-like protein (cupin superfamily)
MIKRLCFLCFLILPFSMAAPERTAPEGFELWTPAAMGDAAKALSTKAATDAHHAAVQQLSSFNNEYFLLAHREADGVVEWHETEADVFVVESGTATLLVGGTQVNGETTTPHEKRGGTIEGGVRQTLSSGDIVRIPPRAPHQLLVQSGQEFTYFVIKVKGY